jgi:hypothetical protein
MLGEVPPVPPPAWAALGVFLFIVCLCFAYAMANLADAICKAFFGAAGSVVGWVPVLGKLAKKPINAIEAKLTSYLDDAVNTLEGQIGVEWHRFARLVDHIGTTIWHLARVAWKHSQLISILTGLWPLYKALRAAIVITAKLVHASKHLLHDLGKRLHGAETFVTKVVYPKVKAVAAPVADVFPRELGRLRAGERALEREVGKLGKLEKRLAALLALGVFAKLVTRALTRLGLGWLHCNSVKQLGRGVCRMPTRLLDDILGLIADFFFFETICQALPFMAEAFSTVASPAIEVLSTRGLKACSAPSQWAAPLHPPAPIAPTVYFTGTLILP